MYKKSVVLIAPAAYSKDRLGQLYPNLALGYIASYLRMNGHRVKIIDAVTEDPGRARPVNRNGNRLYRIGLLDSEIISLIPEETDLIGINVLSNANSSLAFALTKGIKERFPHVPVVLGGSYPSSLPREAINSCADYVVKGEGEVPMLLLAQGEEPRAIRGLISPENSEDEAGNFAEVIDLKDAPFPAYDLLPVDKHLNWYKNRKEMPFLPVITSRGCAFSCDFCVNNAVYDSKWRMRPAKGVLDEINFILQKYGVKHIVFLDDNLIIDRARSVEILDGLIRIKERLRGNFSWVAFCGLRIDLLDFHLLEKIRASGCSRLLLPIENGDENILKRMNRPISLDKVREVVRDCAKLGFTIKADYIIGYPGETRASFKKSIRYFKELKRIGLGPVTIYKTKPFPHTRLYAYCSRNGWLNKDTEHSYFLTGHSTLKNRWVGIVTPDFDQSEINRRQDYAYWKLNPASFLKEIIPGYKLYSGILKKIKYQYSKFFKRMERLGHLYCNPDL